MTDLNTAGGWLDAATYQSLSEQQKKLVDSSVQKATDLMNSYQNRGEGWSPVAQTEGAQAAAAINQNMPQILNQIAQGNVDSSHQDLINKAIDRDPTALQGLSELSQANLQRQQANTQLTNFRNSFNQQEFGAPNATLSEALSNPKSDLGNLNQFLGDQQSRTFKEQMSPMINMQLNGQGLQNSGANIELQSKALGQLEQSRQQNMMQAALGARSQEQGLEQSQIMGDIGSQQTALGNLSDIQRAGVTMQYQRQLMDQQQQLASQLSQYRQGPSDLQMGLGAAGAAASVIGAPFTGGASLAGLPASIAMLGGQTGMQAGQLGQALGQAKWSNPFGGGSVPQYKGSGTGGWNGPTMNGPRSFNTPMYGQY